VAAFEPSGSVAAHEAAYNHLNLPTSDEKAALAGTDGSPSATNEYVTDSDPRNSDARVPLAHVHAPADITPQGSGSTLDADLLDGYDATAFALAGSGVLSLAGTANRVTVSPGTTGNLTATLPDDIHLGVASATTGSIRLYSAGGTKYTLLQPGAPASDLTLTLPITAGTQYQVPGSDGSGVLAFQNVPRAQAGANYVIESGTYAFVAGVLTAAIAFASAYSATPVVLTSIETAGAVQGAVSRSVTVNGFTFVRSSGSGNVTGHWIAYGTKT
jgi:hypothetical protein